MTRISAAKDDGYSVGMPNDSPALALPWPPPGGLRARKPDGGFIDCPVDFLTLPWWVYEQGTIPLQTLRVWLGTLELVEKRCTASPDVPAHYGPEELRRLLRIPRLPTVTDAIERLEDLGLLAWSPHAILFLPHACALKEALAQDGYRMLRSHIATWLRWVPVPRRLLVWLAQDGQPGLIATALGVLLRCMRYKAHQCLSGGRVAVPWIAAVFGVAERTVQRAMQTLEDYGWLARLALQPEREHPHGRYTVINLSWQRPGATPKAQAGKKRAAFVCEGGQPSPALCQNLSPLEGAGCQNLSPLPTPQKPITPENIEQSTNIADGSFQPFQEERQDPEPTRRGPPGVSIHHEQDTKPTPKEPSGILENECVTEEEYVTATERLIAQEINPAFLIRPVVLAEVKRIREVVSRGEAVMPGQASTVPPCPTVIPALDIPLFPKTAIFPEATSEMTLHASMVPVCARPPTRTLAVTLRDVTLEDLRDVGRLQALYQQACVRGWLREGEAEHLNVVAAAVHAQRVGQEPCRLFVALLRDRRWEVITQEDEDRALRMLREHADGPCRRASHQVPAAVPEVPMPDDARFILVAQQVLREAGWEGDSFLAVKMQYPTWTRARWEQAQRALEQWRVRQSEENARQRGCLEGLEQSFTMWEKPEETEDG
jgi:hypothetical protein